jgi:two-component system cell cycle response regulator CpdR
MARILLAEDDDSMRDFLGKALERAGHEVVRVADGEDGLDVLGETPGQFELLLTDIVMPGVNGIELARRAAEVDPGLKIMFITGFAAVALNAGSGAPKQAKVLSKPFHLRDLVDEVARVMAAA